MGVDAIEARDGANVRNQGLIQGDRTGVEAENDAVVDNCATGEITGVNAIDALDRANVRNQGLIKGGRIGVEVKEDAVVDNLATGTIEGFRRGVDIGSGTVTNAGQITGGTGPDGGDGIDIDSGRIVNSGNIQADTPNGKGIDVDERNRDAEIVTELLEIENEGGGRISGEIGINVSDENEAIQKVTNFGEIVGLGGLAITLGFGNDTLANAGSIIGDVDLGTGQDTALIGAGTIFEDIMLFGLGDDTLSIVAGLGDLGLFDGGQGRDIADFFEISVNDVVSTNLGNDTFSLLFGGTRASFRSFETLTFLEGEFRFDAVGNIVAGGAVAPVPIGPSLPLAASGIGLLLLMRARSRQRA